MTIYDREIIIIHYATYKNWAKDLPKENWVCIIVDNDRPRNYLDEVISKIINADVCFVVTIGANSERNHEWIDDEIQYRSVDISKPYLPPHFIFTSYSSDIENGVFYGVRDTLHDEEHIEIDKVVILDMTEGKEIERVMNALKKLNIT